MGVDVQGCWGTWSIISGPSRSALLFTKVQHPAEKLITDLRLSYHVEMGVICFNILNAAYVVAETICNSIQKSIDELMAARFCLPPNMEKTRFLIKQRRR